MPKRTAFYSKSIANHFRAHKPEIVVGPATGGILLAHETAKSLGRKVKAYFTEPDVRGGPRMFLGRGFTIEQGQKVLVVDDVLTTGQSVWRTIRAVEHAGGDIVGIGIVVERSDGSVMFDKMEYFSCLSIDVPSYEQSECHQCVIRIPLVVT